MTTADKRAAISRPLFSMMPSELMAACKGRKGTAFIYANLWDHASGGPENRGNAFPSVDTQARECGMDPKDVREARRWLEANGWLERTDRPGLTPMFRVRLERREAAQDQTPRGNAPGVKKPKPPLGETPHPTPGGNAPPNKNPLTKTTDQELEPPLVPPVGGERRPSAVATDPCRDLGGQLDQASEPPEPQAPDLPQAWPPPMPGRDRDGFLINPLAPPPAATAAAAPAIHDPEPQAAALELIEPEVLQATQPQPQQPNPPWPLPQPPDPEAEVPVNPKGQKRKAGGFQPVEGDVPAALLPVVRELLAFWASKGGKRTERAWTAQLGQLQRIQDDPAGGTEAVRTQLEAGAQAAVFGKAWMAVTHANWQRYGKRVTPIIGTGFGRRTTLDRVNGAIALVEEAERRAAAAAAQHSGLVLAEVA